MSLKTEFERFIEKVDVCGPDECWEWTASLGTSGYGRFKTSDGKVEEASRSAYRLLVGPIPEKMCVLHTCDNRKCCNGKHLFLGTRCDNNKDMAAKGRARSPVGENDPMAKLKEVDIPAIRNNGLSLNKTAALYGVSKKQILNIRQRKQWRHVP